MQARVTLFEIDTLRIGLADALEVFKERVLPRLHQQPGCEGVMALETPEGKGMLISFWSSPEAADEAVKSGFYDEQVGEFTMFMRQPTDRQHYEVVFQELNAAFKAEATPKQP